MNRKTEKQINKLSSSERGDEIECYADKRRKLGSRNQ